jgi:polysaccharide export outer membrane protein
MKALICSRWICSIVVSVGVLAQGVYAQGVSQAVTPAATRPAVTQTAVTQTDSGANLPAQKVGPNDMLSITVYESPELSRAVRVGADGMIRLPMLKRKIRAEGVMPGDLEALIAGALEEEEIVVEPFVTVAITEYHSRPVSVMGAVKQPVTLQAETPITLLEALARAGGLSPEAGPEILISRKQTEAGQEASSVQRVSVRELIDVADPALNVVLKGGEEIRVPEAGRIYVVGNVRKPGAFTIQNGGASSVLKAVAQSEGLLQFAGPQAFIYRVDEATGVKNEIPVDLGKIMQRKAPDAPLMANDIFYVPDNKRQRLTIGALEKLLVIGGGATAALVYTLR